MGLLTELFGKPAAVNGVVGDSPRVAGVVPFSDAGPDLSGLGDLLSLTRQEVLDALFDAAIDSFDLALPDAAFGSPDQPRVPAGSPEGGEWTSGGGGRRKYRSGKAKPDPRFKQLPPRGGAPPAAAPGVRPPALGDAVRQALEQWQAEESTDMPLHVLLGKVGEKAPGVTADGLKAWLLPRVKDRTVKLEYTSRPSYQVTGKIHFTGAELGFDRDDPRHDRVFDAVKVGRTRDRQDFSGLARFAFDPDQPRVPSGQPGGGEWASGGGADVGETTARWEKEDRQRGRRQEKESEALEERQQEEWSALSEARDREDAATEKRRDKEDGSIERRRDREETQEQSKSERAAQRAKDREDAASFAREKATPTYREWVRLDREYGPGSRESQEAWQRHEDATGRNAEDARLQKAHGQIDRNAEEYMDEWRAGREKVYAEEDAAREQARAAEDAARRDAEDEPVRARHEQETQDLAARHEAEDAEVYARRRADHPAAHAAHYDTGDAPFYSPDQPRAPAGSPEGGRWTKGAGTDEARAAASDAVRAFAGGQGPPTAAEAEALAGHLARLTVAQIHALKAEHGLKGSAPNKAALVAKLAERFRAHRAANPVAPVLNPQAMNDEDLDKAWREEVDRANRDEGLAGGPRTQEDIDRFNALQPEWYRRYEERRAAARAARKEERKGEAAATVKEQQEWTRAGKMPDGRQMAKPGDEVTLVTRGAFGSGAMLRGKVLAGPGGKLKVQITGGADQLGISSAGVGKTIDWTPQWTVKGDPEIERRKQARAAAERAKQEESRKSQEEAASAADRSKSAALAAGEHPLDPSTVKPGDVITAHWSGSPQRKVVTEIDEHGGVYARDEAEPAGTTGGFIGDPKHFTRPPGQASATPATKPVPPPALPPAPPPAPAPVPRPATAPEPPPGRRGRKLPSPQAISDFQPGVDRVVRRGDRTYVTHGGRPGGYRDVEVQSDRLTPQYVQNARKMEPDQLVKAMHATANTPYLSEEGRRERLAVLSAVAAGKPLPADILQAYPALAPYEHPA